MLKHHTPDNRSLTGTMPLTTQPDLETTLSYTPETGMFTFSGVLTPIVPTSITGAFQIALTGPQKIFINTAAGMEFMPLTDNSKPFAPLPFNTSSTIEHSLVSPTRLEINVTHLPSTRAVLGFLLFVRLVSDSSEVLNIETPPFFISQDHFTGLEFDLHYDPVTGEFKITELAGQEIKPTIKVTRGVVLLRLRDSRTANTAIRNIRVFLKSEGMAFATRPAVFTMTDPPDPTSPTATRLSDTEILITRDFTPGTGFGVSFGVQIPSGGQALTIYSPDPIIIDKQVGTGGEG